MGHSATAVQVLLVVFDLGKVAGIVVVVLSGMWDVSSRSDRLFEAVDILFDFVERGWKHVVAPRL